MAKTEGETPPEKSGSENPVPKKIPLIVPSIIAGAFFMDGLDSSIIVTSLPQMASSLGTTPARMGAAITAYLLAVAIFIPVSGWVADRFGPRNVFCCAIALFTLGSVLCGFSTSLNMLIASRVVQGMGGALMTPVGRLILQRTFPKDQLMRAMSYNMLPALIGPTIGPVVGGFITTNFSWHWNFFVNLPLGIIGIILAARYIGDIKMVKPKKFDWKGFAIIAVALALSQFALENLGQHHTSMAWEMVLIAGAVVMLAAYGIYAMRHDSPVLDLRVFHNRLFSIATLAGGLVRMNINATLFLMPLLLQVGFGLNPFQTGLLTFFFTGGSLMMRANTQHVVRRFGMRKTLTFAATMSAIFMAGLSFMTPLTPHVFIGGYLVCFGIMRSLQLITLATLTVADVPDEEMSRANAVSSLMQRFSQSLGTGVAASLLGAIAGNNAMSASDFPPVFFVFAALSAIAAGTFWRMRPEDGWQVSGHRRKA